MSFDPERYLELCRELVNDPDYEGEVTYRTIVGRAYYAAFLTVKGRFQAVGRPIKKKKKAHQPVIDALKSVDEGLGDKLFLLLRSREKSDYVLEARIDLKTATDSVGLSEYIVSRARSTIR